MATASPSPALPLTPTLILLHIEVGKGTADPGFQTYRVDFGLRNGTSLVSQFDLPHANQALAATVTIKEKVGKTYAAEVSLRDPAPPIADPNIAAAGTLLTRIPLPPGMALCGVFADHLFHRSLAGHAIDATDRVLILTAQGQIPLGSSLSTLALGPYPDLDLTIPPSLSSCTPAFTGAPTVPADVSIAVGGSVTATAAVHLDRVTITTDRIVGHKHVILFGTTTNTDKFDALGIQPFLPFAVDDDGVVRTFGLDLPDDLGLDTSGADLNGDSALPCDLFSSASPFLHPIHLGPAQSARLNICFEYRGTHRIAAFLLPSSRDVANYQTVLAP